MEMQNKLYFKSNFIHRNMHTLFIRQQHSHNWRTPKEFEEKYWELIQVERAQNKFNNEYKKKLEVEMMKFTGKLAAGEDRDTASEMTSATKLTKKSGKS
jgi:hypothetical protein